MILQFYKNRPDNLQSIIAKAKAEGLDFFNYCTMMDKLGHCTLGKYLKRYYSEVMFLNSFYLDWFNGSRDIHSQACSYGLTEEDCHSMVMLSKHVHEEIHNSL